MSKKSERAERELLNEVADRYRLQGYRVSVHPHADALPAELREFEVDLLATRRDETVIVEVKRSKRATDVTSQLSQLTALAQSLGWRVDLISEPESEGATWSRSRRHKLLEDALVLLDGQHKEAAVLLACSALEGTLRELARKHHAMEDRVMPIRQLIASLRSRGIIGSAVSERLSRLADARNHAAHAMSIGRFPTANVEDSIGVVLWLNDTEFETPDGMADWFFERFEDPAEVAFYDSREGGYQYPPGEPHDARDVLLTKYPAAPKAAIDDALELIEPLGSEWVLKR